MHSQEDMEQDFLNIDAYFAATNNEAVSDHDVWSHSNREADAGRDAEEEEDRELLSNTHSAGGEEADGEVIVRSTSKFFGSTGANVGGNTGERDGDPRSASKEASPEHVIEDASLATGCCGGHADDEEDERAGHSSLRLKTEAQQSGGATTDNGPDSMDMLDDGSWLDFDPHPTGAELASPTLMRRFGMDNRSGGNDEADEVGDEDDDAEGFLCDVGDDGLLLDDVMDLPDFMDADTVTLLPSPVGGYSRADASPLTVSTSSMNNSRSPVPRDTPAGGAVVASLPSPSPFAGHFNNSAFVRDQDIPDVVNLFSSMYSPSESARQQQQQTPLSIAVPTPQAPSASTMFPFANSVSSPMPAQPSSSQATVSKSQLAPTSGSPFEFFTPPGVTANPARALDPNTIFLSADSLSPPTKSINTAAYQPTPQQQQQAQHLVNGMRAMTQSQAQQHMQAATAAAVAMANSAAAMNTMRKLTQTYGVPIAPLQRSIVLSDAQPLKPKIVNATATSSSTIAATFGASTKVSKISITPDISDFKLVQIFHNFCDPVSKVIPLQRFHQLLQFHQGKDEQPTAAAAAAAAKTAAGTSTPAKAAKDTTTPSAESIALFKTLDKRNTGFLDLEVFMNSFQICNRCTEAKRRAHSAVCAAQGQSFVSTSLERQLMEDVAPVLVRVVPTAYEGAKVKSCDHYQWTWCEGFAKTGNEKCRGTNRHDKCPKYLANCTLWKHKLPPKNRKSKIFENVESPSKKFKHFA